MCSPGDTFSSSTDISRGNGRTHRHLTVMSENSGRNDVVEPAKRHSRVIARAPRPSRIGPRAENLIVSRALVGLEAGSDFDCTWEGSFFVGGRGSHGDERF